MITLLPILARDSDEPGSWVNFVVFAFMAILWAGAKVVEKLKERANQQTSDAQQQTEERPAEPVRGESVEDIVRTMRQARSPGDTVAPPTARPPTTPKPLQRRPQAQVSADQVQAELLAMNRRGSRKRIGGTGERLLGRLEVTADEAEAAPQAQKVQINLGDLDEARRGIIYSEILGPPIALRKTGGLWDQ